MMWQILIVSTLLVYDPGPGPYSVDYDGYGYRCWAQNGPQARARMLIDDLLFESPQMGMEISLTEDRGHAIEVVTTGTRFLVDREMNLISCHQLIGTKREVIRIGFENSELEGIELVECTGGYSLLKADDLTMLASADGLLMVQALADLRVGINILFQFEYLGKDVPSRTKKGFSHLFLDRRGGFGVYLIEDERCELSPERAVYSLHPGQVLWIAIFPPRDYSEDAAKSRLVFSKGDPEAPYSPTYPTSDEFDRWSGVNVDATSFRSQIDGRWGTNPDHIDYGEIVVLASDVELWTSWHTEYVPRCGWDQFHETIELAHARNDRILFYVSPSQFYKGSRYLVPDSEHYLGDPVRPKLITSIRQIYEDQQYWPPGNPEGENLREFLNAVEVMINHRRNDEDHVPDGVYVDGLYFLNIPQSYILLRSLRELLGEDRIICIHSAPMPGGDAYLPTLEAYADYVLKGEGGRKHLQDPHYLEYFIRTYGISNAVGIFKNERDRRGNYTLLKDSLFGKLLEYRLHVQLESPLIDLSSKWDTVHNWEDYRLEIIQLWRAMGLDVDAESR